MAPQARLLLHPAAILPKYVRDRDGSARFIGMPLPCIDAVNSRLDRVVWTEGPVEIVPRIFVTGPIPRKFAYIQSERSFFGVRRFCWHTAAGFSIIRAQFPQKDFWWAETGEG